MSTSTLPQHRNAANFRWPKRTLWDDIAGHAGCAGDTVAVVDAEGSYTYRQLTQLTERLAIHFRDRGVSSGDVVAIQLPPTKVFVPSFLAVERLGAIVSPVLPSIRGLALEKILDLAAPSLIITNDQPSGAGRATEQSAAHVMKREARASGEPLDDLINSEPSPSPTLPEPPKPEVLSELAFTSGTSALPKGVFHLHATATAGIMSTIRRQHITSQDVVHVALPVGHNFGFFYGVRLALHAGAKLVLQQRWDADEMLSLTKAHGITVSAGPPTYLSDLLDLAGSWHSRLKTLRLFTCAGAKLDPDLALQAVKAMPDQISKAFGMTELGHTCSTTKQSSIDKIIRTEGSPHPEIEMKIVGPDALSLPRGNEGIVAFRGPFLMTGYQDKRHNKDAIDEDGFFSTGDLGYEDNDGYLVITGRAKNVVIRGGENIPAEAIESVLSGHPSVTEAVMIGAPDRRLGERPVVCVRGTSEAALSVTDVGEYLKKAGLPVIHWPEAVIMVDTIPRSDTGKIERAKLRQFVVDQHIFD